MENRSRTERYSSVHNNVDESSDFNLAVNIKLHNWGSHLPSAVRETRNNDKVSPHYTNETNLRWNNHGYTYNAVHSIQQTKQIPNDPPQMGAKSTTTSNHPSTPGVDLEK